MEKMFYKLLVFLFFILSVGCNNQNVKMLSVAKIDTNFGEIDFVLLDETPLHKANFQKMVADTFFNDMQFHRVIKNFVIQTGNQNSKRLNASDSLVDGGADHVVKEEILAKYNHVRGAVGAAREGDNVNPLRNSSGSHFYFVQGLNQNKLTDSTICKGKQLPEYVVERYKKEGGTPHLDGAYTVFGYVIEGMDVVDKIADVETGKGDRPLTNVVINTINIVEVTEESLSNNPMYPFFASSSCGEDCCGDCNGDCSGDCKGNENGQNCSGKCAKETKNECGNECKSCTK